MENISEGERILLGYSPRDPFGGVESRSQRWNADLDVFGGPPRRPSTRSSRRIRADSIDLYSRLSRGREDLVGSHCFCFGSGEKPVFGEIGGGSSLRQQLEDDFYGDIFQINEAAFSSLRRGDAASLTSSSSSRVSSPNRPTQNSLSERMTKVSGHSAFDSPTKRPVDRSRERGYDAFSDPSSPNGSSDDSFTTQSVAGFGDLQNNGYGSNRQSPLSRKISLGSEGFSEAMEPAFRTVESQTGKVSSFLEDYISNRQFHFSIYKWAGKGVMLVKPSDSNEINRFEGLTSLPEVIVQELELPTNCDYFFPVTKPLKLGTVFQETKSDKKVDDYAKTPAKSDKKVTNITSDVKQNPENSFNVHTKQNPELKSLTQLFDSDMNKQRSHDIPIHVNEREAQSKNQKKEQGESKLVPGEVNSTTLHDILSSSEDKARENNVKGKVKKFIKKFSQLSPHKKKGAFEMLNRRPKGEDGGLDKFDELAHVFSLEPDKLQGGIGNKSIPLFDIPKFMENQVIEKAEEQNFSISCNDLIIDDCPSEESVEVLNTQSEDLNNAKWCEEIIHEDIEYLVQQLPVKQTEDVQISSHPDLIKKLDADIWQWSKGKEGNIRSLLSTLQLVLWPESGWKQVPLVNIIEGPSVKKAYQKALLCLHPDKLQQKGASWNQKYIAEKVFDILQEAWDNFNSMSQF